MTFLLITGGFLVVLASLFAFGAANRSSYLSQQPPGDWDEDEYRRHNLAGSAGWSGTADPEDGR